MVLNKVSKKRPKLHLRPNFFIKIVSIHY